MKKIIFKRYLINFVKSKERDGWWLKDNNGFKHCFRFCISKVEENIDIKEPLSAWYIVLGRYKLEIGKL